MPIRVAVKDAVKKKRFSMSMTPKKYDRWNTRIQCALTKKRVCALIKLENI